LAGLVVATALVGGTVSADNEWSPNDPVFNIRGTVFHLTTSVQADAWDVTSITYDVTMPADAEGATTVAYPRSGRFPTIVNVTYAGAPSGPTYYEVSVSVSVSGPAGAAVRLDLTGPSVTAQSWTGTTNSAVSANFTAQK
jgi:hypothetical protein